MQKLVKFPMMVRCSPKKGKPNQLYFCSFEKEVEIQEVSPKDALIILNGEVNRTCAVGDKLFRRISTNASDEQLYSHAHLRSFNRGFDVSVGGLAYQWYKFMLSMTGGATTRGMTLYPRLDTKKDGWWDADFRNKLTFQPAELKEYAEEDIDYAHAMADVCVAKTLKIGNELFVETRPPCYSVGVQLSRNSTLEIFLVRDFLPDVTNRSWRINFPVSQFERAERFKHMLSGAMGRSAQVLDTGPDPVRTGDPFLNAGVDLDFDFAEEAVHSQCQRLAANLVRRVYQWDFHSLHRNQPDKGSPEDLARVAELEDKLRYDNSLLGEKQDYAPDVEDLFDIWHRFRRPSYDSMEAPPSTAMIFLKQYVSGLVDDLPVKMNNSPQIKPLI
jgi:hypothetical protein